MLLIRSPYRSGVTFADVLVKYTIRPHNLHIIRFRAGAKSSFIPVFVLSPKSHAAFRGPRFSQYKSMNLVSVVPSSYSITTSMPTWESSESFSKSSDAICAEMV